MTIIDRIDCAATRAQLIAMAAVQDMGRTMRAGSGGDSAEGRDPEEGATTVEYAIGALATAGFAGLLLVVLKSGVVQSALEQLISSALSIS